MLTLYLARHGQDRDNARAILNGHRDEPLTETGVTQAQEIADKIKKAGMSFHYIYSSPLQRAHETANIIAAHLEQTPPEILEDLIERNFGVMTGQAQSRVIELCSPDLFKTETITYFLNPEGAETFPQLLERADRLLKYLKEKHADGNILLVTHGDMGKMIYAAYYHLSWMDVLRLFHFGNSDLLELSQTSKPEEAHVFKIQQHNL